jgi:hypothetical protein
MRVPLSSPRKLYLTLFLLTFLATLMPPRTAHGQGLELSGGYAHVIQTCSLGASHLFCDQFDRQTQAEPVWRGTVWGVTFVLKSDMGEHAKRFCERVFLDAGRRRRLLVPRTLVRSRELGLAKNTLG